MFQDHLDRLFEAGVCGRALSRKAFCKPLTNLTLTQLDFDPNDQYIVVLAQVEIVTLKTRSGHVGNEDTLQMLIVVHIRCWSDLFDQSLTENLLVPPSAALAQQTHLQAVRQIFSNFR